MRELPGVLLTAGRLVARHWPALLALGFLGSAVRSGALWAAIVLSDRNAQLGQLMLILAPLGYLLPVIAMLHICRGSLPRLTELNEHRSADSPTEGRERRLVDIAASVLVPFLAVYVSYGLLERDIFAFRNEAVAQEANQNFLDSSVRYDFRGRVGIYSFQIAVMIVAIAWVLRWALGRIENVTKFLALAFVGALVEVYYTAQLAGQSLVIKTDGEEWFRQRAAVRWFQDGYDAVLDRVGILADPLSAALGAIQSLLGSFDAVVVVPIAWLTVGAIVLGHKLDDESEGPRTEEEHVGLVRSFLRDLASRWQAFWSGLKLLASAGLYPMLVFSLAFLVVIRIPTLVAIAVRHLVGPQQINTWLAFSPMEGAFALALSMAVTAPLLAAAVDWLVAARQSSAVLSPGPRAPRSQGSPTTAAPS